MLDRTCFEHQYHQFVERVTHLSFTILRTHNVRFPRRYSMWNLERLWLRIRNRRQRLLEDLSVSRQATDLNFRYSPGQVEAVRRRRELYSTRGGRVGIATRSGSQPKTNLNGVRK